MKLVVEAGKGKAGFLERAQEGRGARIGRSMVCLWEDAALGVYNPRS